MILGRDSRHRNFSSVSGDVDKPFGLFAGQLCREGERSFRRDTQSMEIDQHSCQSSEHFLVQDGPFVRLDKQLVVLAELRVASERPSVATRKQSRQLDVLSNDWAEHVVVSAGRLVSFAERLVKSDGRVVESQKLLVDL
jgi:hypothetical protein